MKITSYMLLYTNGKGKDVRRKKIEDEFFFFCPSEMTDSVVRVYGDTILNS